MTVFCVVRKSTLLRPPTFDQHKPFQLLSPYTLVIANGEGAIDHKTCLCILWVDVVVGDLSNVNGRDSRPEFVDLVVLAMVGISAEAREESVARIPVCGEMYALRVSQVASHSILAEARVLVGADGEALLPIRRLRV